MLLIIVLSIIAVLWVSFWSFVVSRYEPEKEPTIYLKGDDKND